MNDPTDVTTFWKAVLQELKLRLTKATFETWLALRAFPWDSRRIAWPSIRTLSAIACNGNRSRIIDRAARAGRAETTDALEVLEDYGLVSVSKDGRCYLFRQRVSGEPVW